jgi:hemerythrin-like domain-containing protein
MLRDKNLIPLSRQHQHALAMCVRLKRALQAGEVDSEAWQAEITQLFKQEIGFHFAAEEKEVFPSAAQFLELRGLVEELKAEHEVLRKLFLGAQGRGLNRCELGALQAKLTAHIRKEERQLFEEVQERMSAEQMVGLGTGVERALAEASKACALPGRESR